MKKIGAMFLGGIMAITLAACGKSSQPAINSQTEPAGNVEDKGEQEDKETVKTQEQEIVIQIGFENSISEPIGQALEYWQKLVKEKGDGSIRLELYPDSQLGNKNDLIDSMLLGEPVCTLADGAFFVDYGVPDFGITMGPFLFDTWEDCWTLLDSEWYAQQEAALEEKGLKLLTSNWIYGARNLLTTKPVGAVADLKGMKIRVPANQIQAKGFEVLDAAPVGMAFGEVYQAIQSGTVEGVENVLSGLYGQKLHEVAPYLLMSGHVKNFCVWLVSADFFNSLTPEQQELLLTTGEEAGFYNNDLQNESAEEYLQLLIEEGVTVTEMSQQLEEEFKEKAQAFYEMEDTFGWSDGLFETVMEAMGK